MPEVQLRYATAKRKDGKSVFIGGGNLSFRDKDGERVRMKPGDVLNLPKSMIDRFPGKFVKPGSQVEKSAVDGSDPAPKGEETRPLTDHGASDDGDTDGGDGGE